MSADRAPGHRGRPMALRRNATGVDRQTPTRAAATQKAVGGPRGGLSKGFCLENPLKGTLHSTAQILNPIETYTGVKTENGTK